MGRSHGGLTGKIHAGVDANGLPVRLALTADEANDKRLAANLLSRLHAGSMLLAEQSYDADWIRALDTRQALGPTYRREATATSRSVLAGIFTERVTWSNGSSIGSNTVGG